jgi:hypothetical protein
MIKFRMMVLTRKKKTDTETDSDDTEEIIVEREKETGQPL